MPDSEEEEEYGESGGSGQEVRGNGFHGKQRESRGYSCAGAGVLLLLFTATGEETKTLDHVVPLAEGGSNSYRNLVSCCADCNFGKRENRAGDFLRQLYREGKLTAAGLTERLRKLKAVAEGRLRPALEGTALPSADWEEAKVSLELRDSLAAEFAPAQAEAGTGKSLTQSIKSLCNIRKSTTIGVTGKSAFMKRRIEHRGH